MNKDIIEYISQRYEKNNIKEKVIDVNVFNQSSINFLKDAVMEKAADLLDYKNHGE